MAETLEDRVARLEKMLAELQQQSSNRFPWLDSIFGKYTAGDPFIRAMKLGGEYRKSLRPQPRKGKSKTKSGR